MSKAAQPGNAAAVWAEHMHFDGIAGYGLAHSGSRWLPVGGNHMADRGGVGGPGHAGTGARHPAEKRPPDKLLKAASVSFTQELDEPRTELTRAATSRPANTDAMHDRDRQRGVNPRPCTGVIRSASRRRLPSLAG